MTISLKNTQNRRLTATSKVHPIPKQNSVFSYTVKKVGAAVVLSQKETGFVYSIKMEPVDKTLLITQFTLTKNMKLASLSSELHDVAFLEIFVQALMILFARADQYGVDEILFMLSQEDATHLMEFEDFFNMVKSLSTREGSKILFTVYNTWEAREFLKEKVGTIKTKLKQELWQMQRGSHYIKHFLQNHPRGSLLPLLTLQDENVSQHRGTVIPFPQHARK